MYLFIIFIKNSNIASVVADSLPTSHIDNNSPQPSVMTTCGDW